MNQPRIDRLLQLAGHLEKGQLGHQEFNFSVYNTGPQDRRYAYKDALAYCGTTGCAIGECPFVFKEWYFNKYATPVCLTQHSPRSSAQFFFQLDLYECNHLFYPEMQLINTYGGKRLAKDARKEAVAENIRIFCKQIARQ